METCINIIKHIGQYVGPGGSGFVFVLVFAFIVLDFATGLVKAFSQRSYSSTKSREGLFHKSGLILCVVLGVLVDAGQAYMDLGFSVPTTLSVCAYICIMETGSILENICQICPELAPEQLRALFGGIRQEKEQKHD